MGEEVRDMTDLLPCPFCGSEGIQYKDEAENRLVACVECEATAYEFYWNRRAASAAGPALADDTRPKGSSIPPLPTYGGEGE